MTDGSSMPIIHGMSNRQVILDWMQEVLLAKGWKPKNWADATTKPRLAATTITRFINDPENAPFPSGQTLFKLAEAASVDPPGRGKAAKRGRPTGTNDSFEPDVIPAKAVDFGPDEVAVYGYAAGAVDEVLNLHDGAEIGRVVRHPKQAGINKAFAVYVVGESMTPRFKPGQLLYILPGRWPAAGEDVVIELKNGDGYIKEYRRRTQKEIICWQYNPDGEWRRPLSQVRAVHSVAGTG